MLKLTSTILFIGISLKLLSQEVTWMYGSGDWTDDRVNDNVIDQDGNVYFTGYLSGGTMIGDTTYQSWGAYVAKFDADGNYRWSHRFGDFSTYGTSLAVDSQNNVYVVGSYDRLNYEGTDLSYAWSQTFVMKISSDGQFMWLKGFGPAGTNGNFFPGTVQVDQHDHLYVAGRFNIDVTIGEEVFNVTGRERFDQDVLVLKLDEDGDLIHGIQLASTSAESIQDMKIVDDHVLLVGFSTGSVIDVNGYSYERPFEVYSFIAKFDLQGVTEWVRPLENGNNYQFGVDRQHNFVFAFQPWNTTINGYAGLKLQKTDEHGNELFARAFDQLNVDEIGIAVEDLDIYLTAGFESEQIDHWSLAAEGRDVAILKFNEVGYLQWGTSLAGSATDDGMSISVRDQSIFVTGEYNSAQLSADDQLIFNNSGNNDDDFFVARLLDTAEDLCPPDDAFTVQYPEIACRQDSIPITLTDDYAISVDWYKDGQLFEAGNVNEIKITEAGTYTILINAESSCAVAEKKLVVSNEDQVSNETDLILYDLPEVSITAPALILKDEDMVFSTIYDESYHYEWFIQRIKDPQNLTNSNEVTVRFEQTFEDVVASVLVTHKVTGCSQSDTLVFAVEQLLSAPEKAVVSLFPNPSGDHFEIKSSQPIVRSVVKDLSGRVIKSVRSSSVAVGDLPSGVYLVEIQFRDAIVTRKLVRR